MKGSPKVNEVLNSLLADELTRLTNIWYMPRCVIIGVMENCTIQYKKELSMK